MAVWRPANIDGIPKQAEGVINQLLRETNQRIDNLAKQTPQHQFLKGSAVLNFGSIPANSSVERIVNLLGVGQSHTVHASPTLPPDINGVLIWSARVNKNGQVAVRMANPTASPVVANTIKWQVVSIA